jgi:glycine oxidase
MHDVAVVGGGVIGLSIGYELAKRGARVLLLEQGQLGREASWAGAGILPPGCPAGDDPLAPLCAATHRLWPALSEELCERTGIDNGYRRCGGLAFAATDVHAEVAAWRAADIEAELLDANSLARYEPEVAPRWATGAYRLPGMAQVRNPRHLKALVAACTAQGVELREGQPLLGIDRSGSRAVAVRTPSGQTPVGRVVVASGAWSAHVLGTLESPPGRRGLAGAEAGGDGTRSVPAPLSARVEIEPVRGQIVLVSAQPLPFRHVLECGRRYLVPREDGRVLIGSTEEWVGFQKANTAEAVAGLLTFACGLVPALRAARFEQAWSGLRPHAPRGRPYLGRVPDFDNVYVAAGHFRGGLNLSPITGRLMAQVVSDERPEPSLDAFGM